MTVGLRLQVNTDGGSRGNPGPAAIGAVLRNLDDPDFAVVAEISETIGTATNNVAEYKAVIAGLEAAQKLSAEGVYLESDSELLVKQLKGEYKVRQAHLVPLHRRCRELLGGFGEAKVRHVRRERNVEADALVNQALDAQAL